MLLIIVMNTFLLNLAPEPEPEPEPEMAEYQGSFLCDQTFTIIVNVLSMNQVIGNYIVCLSVSV